MEGDGTKATRQVAITIDCGIIIVREEDTSEISNMHNMIYAAIGYRDVCGVMEMVMPKGDLVLEGYMVSLIKFIKSNFFLISP